MSEQVYENTDRELWREEDDFYAPSIFVTDGGKIGINVGGYVFVKDVRDWHELAENEEDVPKLLAEVERLNTDLAKYRQRDFEQICDDWFALTYGEFEDDGVVLTRHENKEISGWWAHYEVEFSYFGKSYAFKYRKHTSPNCCDHDITEDIHEAGGAND